MGVATLRDTYQGRGTYRLFNINERFHEFESVGLYQDSILMKKGTVCVCVCVCKMGGWVNAITIRAMVTASLIIKACPRMIQAQ